MAMMTINAIAFLCSEREVFREFGDAAEAVGRRDGNSGFQGLLGIKFELDFHYRLARGCRSIDDKLSIQKSSIGGNQYLAYLWESGWLSLYI